MKWQWYPACSTYEGIGYVHQSAWSFPPVSSLRWLSEPPIVASLDSQVCPTSDRPPLPWNSIGHKWLKHSLYVDTRYPLKAQLRALISSIPTMRLLILGLTLLLAISLAFGHRGRGHHHRHLVCRWDITCTLSAPYHHQRHLICRWDITCHAHPSPNPHLHAVFNAWDKGKR